MLPLVTKLERGHPMIDESKITQGTPEWLHMIGGILVEAARTADLPDDMNLSFVERYTGGKEIGDGLIQGIRLDFVKGEPTYRIGAGRDETGDITVEVTPQAARDLNLYRSDDPTYKLLLERYQALGEWKAEGDLSLLADWLGGTHDQIVERTK